MFMNFLLPIGMILTAFGTQAFYKLLLRYSDNHPENKGINIYLEKFSYRNRFSIYMIAMGSLWLILELI